MASSRPLPDSAAARVGAMPTRVFLLVMAAFIVYGSLFPFNFLDEPRSLARFFAEWDLFANRADAIDNVLLFVPFGIGLHAHYRSARGRLLAGALALLVLGVGIQLAQLYLPSRTASLADVVWNAAGMAAGLLAASWVRPLVAARMAAHGGGRDRFAMLLLLLWFFYESFPFVPTLDLGELRAHVKTVVNAPPFELMRLVQHGLAATLAGVAVQRTNWLRSPVLALLAAGGLALFLEVFVAYGQLRRETMLGIVLGMLLAGWLEQRQRRHSMHLVLLLALAACLLTVFTPYRGQLADGGFTWTPFSNLLWRGATPQLVPAAFEALAIGALLWGGMAGLKRFERLPWAWAGLVLLLLVLLEAVRALLAGYHADTTSLVMALVLAPAAVAWQRVTAAIGSGATAPPAPDTAPAPTPAPAAVPPDPAAASAARWWPLLALLLALTLGMWVLVQLPSVPYNLKKLFGEQALAGAAFFSVALLWLGSGPWLAVHLVQARLARRQRALFLLPLLLVGLALVSYLLLNLATPEIMLNKIIGAPDLYRRIVDDNLWGDAWRASVAAWPAGLFSATERVLRFIALYCVFMVPLLLSMLAMGRREDRGARVVFAALVMLPCWLLAKLVVLDWSITDNVTELVSDGGEYFLGLDVLLFGAYSTALGAYAPRRRAWPALLLAGVAVLGASWGLLNLGIEDAVLNNDRLFSGVQFLLGQNRSDILPDSVLAARWCALFLGAALVVAAGMRLAMQWRAPPLPPPRRRRPRTAPAAA